MLGVGRVHMVAASGGTEHVLPVRLQLLMRAGVFVVFGGHLRQNAITQSQGGVAKAFQPAGPEHLFVYCRARNNNFSALGVNASDGGALLDIKAREPLKQFAHGIQGGVSAGQFQ